MKKSICIIDDDEIYQKIIKKLISRADAFDDAIFYKSAKEMLHDLINSEIELPSVILLDINMPIMDGWQFLENLENAFPLLYENTEIYMVTSSIAYSDREKVEEYPNLSGFLSKPMSVEKLKEIGNSVK